MSVLAEQFLKEPVPPGGTKEWRDWLARYQPLKEEDPKTTATIFLRGLEHGDLNEQYAAVLGLRMIGYEAYGLGYEPQLDTKSGHLFARRAGQSYRRSRI